jgi:hypothetical protein
LALLARSKFFSKLGECSGESQGSSVEVTVLENVGLTT